MYYRKRAVACSLGFFGTTEVKFTPKIELPPASQSECFDFQLERVRVDLRKPRERELRRGPALVEEFSFRARLRSFGNAFRGIGFLLSTQHNAWIHAVATCLVVTAAFYFGLSRLEGCLLVLAMMMVWSAEGANTALEFLADFVASDPHPLIGKAKDVAAGAVLLAAIGAAVIGGLIFGPYLLPGIFS